MNIKTSSLLPIFLLIATTGYTQGLKREKCKKKDVQVFEYNSGIIDKGVIVGFGSYKPEYGAKTVDDFTKKDLRKIKTQAGWFSSCKVYVDFKNITIDRKLNPDVNDEYYSLLIVTERRVQTSQD